MLKYVSKFVLEIFPSVVATIVGAYIVNHYIVAKPADAPVAAAISASVPPVADAKAASAKADGKSSDVSNVAEPTAAKAKGGSDKAAAEKSSGEKGSETASAPAETRRHQPVTREKAVAKASQPSAPAVAPVATASVAPEPPSSVEERRDANDLARAAIERLRNSGEAARAPEPVRTPEVPRVQDAPRIVSSPSLQPPSLQPLPPAIMVSTPSNEAFNPAAPRMSERVDDPRRPRPPADIPTESRPLDLQADATGSTRTQRPSVADDMLSAAKSVFHAVLPK
jgi:hypothetical protein